MSRVIKFRAWDRWSRVMESSPRFMIDLSDGELWENTGQGCSDRLESTGDRFILMQFTGLQDSEGVDIYEGDLLDDKWRAEVRWKNGSWWVHIHVGNNSDKLLYDYLKSRKMAKCPVEVIGNIHEHSHLMEEK